MSEVEITQADRDAWEVYGPAIFHMDISGPEALARHRIAAEKGKAELVEAAEALRDDMLERARIAALLRKDDDIVVEAGAGVWFRFNAALARVRGEG